jgi:hypothetical protein
MKKIYMIAVAVFAVGTLSAQSTGQANSKKNLAKAPASISKAERLPATKEVSKKSKASAIEIKAIENKKKVTTQPK